MGGAAPTLPDTATAFNTRAGLRNFVTAAYDYTANLLRTQAIASALRPAADSPDQLAGHVSSAPQVELRHRAQP